MNKTFPARLEHLHEMLLWIRSQLKMLDAKAMKKLELASEEAIVNAIRHGGAEQIELQLKVSDGFVEVVFRDEGKAFDPLKFEPKLDGSAPGGLGIHLMRSSVDKVSYRREGNANVLTLIRSFQRG